MAKEQIREHRVIGREVSEETSIYHKIDSFKKDVYEHRAKEAVRNGQYSSLKEALENTPMPNVMSVVKSIALKKQIPTSSIDTKIKAIDYVVTRIMQISPTVFYNIWSTENNKKYFLYPTINAITNAAPSDYWKECYFDSKLVFFKMVWPDVYEKKMDTIDCYDIYTCSENSGIKAALKHAGTPSLSSRKSQAKGTDVDEIMMDAIYGILEDKMGFTTYPEMFNYLAEDSKKYQISKNKSCSKLDSTAPGICEVIESRGYPSLLDFFYLQLAKETQIEHAGEFLGVRRVYGLAPEPLIENAIEALLEMKSKERE